MHPPPKTPSASPAGNAGRPAAAPNAAAGAGGVVAASVPGAVASATGDAVLPLSATLEQRAREGDPRAQFALAERFGNGWRPFECKVCDGKITPETLDALFCPDCGAPLTSFAAAVSWYMKANLQNYAPAALRLCEAFYFGLGAGRDASRARHFFRRAKVAYPALVWPPSAPLDRWEALANAAAPARLWTWKLIVFTLVALAGAGALLWLAFSVKPAGAP